MNALAATIQSANLTGTAAEIVASLDADGPPLVNNTRYSYAGLVRHPSCGMAVAGVLLVTFEQTIAMQEPPSGYSSEEWLLRRAFLRAEMQNFMTSSEDSQVGGLDFSQPERQSTLSQWAASAEQQGNAQAAAALDIIRSLAVQPRKRWESLGLESLPTAEQVQVALNQIENVDWVTSVLEPQVTALKIGGGDLATTKAAILALVQ